jgi:opacity protein-like surface antigen
MRFVLAASLVLGLMAAPAMVVPASADTMKNCAATWKGMSAADKAQTSYMKFMPGCMKGTSVLTAATPAMAAPAQPMTPTTKMAAPAVSGGGQVWANLYGLLRTLSTVTCGFRSAAPMIP